MSAWIGTSVQAAPVPLVQALFSPCYSTIKLVTSRPHRRKPRLGADSKDNYIVTAMISRMKEMTAAPP